VDYIDICILLSSVSLEVFTEFILLQCKRILNYRKNTGIQSLTMF